MIILDAGVITMAECRVGPVRAGQLDAFEDFVGALGIKIIPLLAGADADLANLRAETGLKLPDCCVLAAAAETGARLATFDIRLEMCARAMDIEVVPPTPS